MSENEKNKLLDKIEALLTRVNGPARALRLERGLAKVEDEWLYAVVTGATLGHGAAEYSKLMSDIEKTLREQDHANVLLVPAIGD